MAALEAVMGKHGVTMRELQKMSAATLRALPHTMPIKSGDETVALLTPLRRPDPEKMAEVLRRIDEHHAKLTPETRIWLERFMSEREG
jgi:hypothetical protein